MSREAAWSLIGRIMRVSTVRDFNPLIQVGGRGSNPSCSHSRPVCSARNKWCGIVPFPETTVSSCFRLCFRGRKGNRVCSHLRH